MTTPESTAEKVPLIGASIPRVEDRAFLTGAGTFTADLRRPGQAHAAFVRTPHAHAVLGEIDPAAALAVPGVLAVYTAADLRAAGVRALPTGADEPLPDGELHRAIVDAPHYPLAEGRVRFAGEAVALVAAETEAAALEAAELVEVDYEPLPALGTAEDALADDAAAIWEDAPDNRSVVWAAGDRAATDAAFAAAHRVVGQDIAFTRSTAAFMEPRGALAEYADGRFTLHAGSQSGHVLRAIVADCLGIGREDLRVIVPDTGGGFGARNLVYPEFVVVPFAARSLGRPVRWIASRSEAFLTDTQSRSQNLHARIALDAEGRITAVDVRADWWHGAYWVNRAPHVIVTWMSPMICGPYRIPAYRFEFTGVFTNTAPIAAYRGIARAEATLVLERLIDRAARETGTGRVDLRRRNLIPLADMPWQAPTGARYQRNDFLGSLDAGLARIDWDGFAERRAASALQGLRRGRSVTTYIENAGGALAEFADIRVEAPEPEGGPEDGRVRALVGSQDSGMGHATVFGQILADLLGVSPDRVVVEDGDTDRIPQGGGSHGSRTMRIGGGAIHNGALSLIEAGRPLAADLLEAAAADIGFAGGAYRVQGTDRTVSLFAVAAEADRRGAPLRIEERFEVPGMSYPSGCHLCEVEVDPETGAARIERYVVVSDPGTVINPLLAAGQLHGGIAMGVGQAMMENTVYESGTGQLLSGSFMDFCLPRADDMPPVDTVFNPVAGDDNPLGVKGIGEGPTTASPPTAINAVLDALAEDGVTTLDMPLTPHTVWRALEAARG
ncbi:MAG: xanthine dehydrogenase family protein molybdopterin-binding subunit [Rhodospirillaceae bacterium]|nr:xanthine dehydrogenase family protein molybdopterin-binding subunit [Rhodospirillaceae bacterium]MDE0617174.1 xanthine dehydrogenase family protein molybdopterin-binding subunit [Rhodospirillaceae bacterium]